ncbi:hypothetical protein GCM10010339_57450 [Streptomyces alanosinicus]|uniref:Uncharacterized protein n=1 Tax=Streptomyces alanosinicus TaxID=68171 RepID=A0A919D5A5_9ACTN|nr:hypothetical protein GCM10010339_57450 [Streptomyces alanosinicus]
MSVASAPGRAWLSEQDCDLDAFRALIERTTHLADYPHAASVAENVLVYEAERLRAAHDRDAVRAEPVRAFADGPGIVVVRGAFPDLSVVDRVTSVFEALIAERRGSGATPGARPRRRTCRGGRCARSGAPGGCGRGCGPVRNGES